MKQIDGELSKEYKDYEELLRVKREEEKKLQDEMSSVRKKMQDRRKKLNDRMGQMGEDQKRALMRDFEHQWQALDSAY